MTILLKIETHVYAEDTLHDEILDENLPDDIDSCGIVGPEIIVPLRRHRHNVILWEYSKNTKLLEVEQAILKYLQVQNDGSIKIAFWSEGIRYWVEDANASFDKAVIKHLDPQNSGFISVGAYVSADAGSICEENGIRYYMNSREKGLHHEAHIHICDSSRTYEAVIIIKNGKVIGKFPRKLQKIAKKTVRENQAFFLEKWNTLTDGLKVDINHFLGTIHY